MDFENIILNRKQLKLLKAAKYKSINYSHDCNKLVQYGLINYSEYKFDEIGNHVPSGNSLKITAIGKDYLIYIQRKFNAAFYPILISVIGVAVAIAGLIFRC